MAIDENKQKALAAALGQIEKQFGKGSIMRLGEDRSMDVETISTGSLSLDIALGAGGLPMGRIVEIYGPESSGKTTLTLQVIASAQRKGKTCAFIDAEHALDPVYARKLGVDIDNLLCSQPDTGEQALEICDALARSGAVDVIVVDSVAALTPKAEIEGEIGDSHMGLAARMMSQAMRKLAGNLKQSNTLLIFINQIRMKIGVMFGTRLTTSGRWVTPALAVRAPRSSTITATTSGVALQAARKKTAIATLRSGTSSSCSSTVRPTAPWSRCQNRP